MSSNLGHYFVYSTVGFVSAHLVGVYSALPLQFRRLSHTSSAIVLEKKRYELLIGAEYFKEFDGILNHQKWFLLLVRYYVLISKNELSNTEPRSGAPVCLNNKLISCLLTIVTHPKCSYTPHSLRLIKISVHLIAVFSIPAISRRWSHPIFN